MGEWAEKEEKLGFKGNTNKNKMEENFDTSFQQNYSTYVYIYIYV